MDGEGGPLAPKSSQENKSGDVGKGKSNDPAPMMVPSVEQVQESFKQKKATLLFKAKGLKVQVMENLKKPGFEMPTKTSVESPKNEEPIFTTSANPEPVQAPVKSPYFETKPPSPVLPPSNTGSQTPESKVYNQHSSAHISVNTNQVQLIQILIEFVERKSHAEVHPKC